MSRRSSEKSYKFSTLAVIFSLLLHAGFFALVKLLPPPKPSQHTQDIEVLYNQPTNQLMKQYNRTIKEAHLKELNNQLSKLEKQVHFLSENQKRYKKQMVAKSLGVTKNRTTKKATKDKKLGRKDKKNKKTQGSKLALNSKGEKFYVKPTTESLGRPNPLAPQGHSSFLRSVPHIQSGEVTLLNTDQFTYYAFYNRLNNQFASRWAQFVNHFNSQLTIFERNKLSYDKHVTRIEAVLDPNGELLEVYLHQSSGVKGLDQAVLRAINKVAPVQNPPEDLIEDDGLIHLHYALQVQWRRQYVAESPEN